MAECGAGRELNPKGLESSRLYEASRLPTRAEPVHFVGKEAELATGDSAAQPFEGSEYPSRSTERRRPEENCSPIGAESPLELPKDLETFGRLEVLHDTEIPDPVDGILPKGEMANVGADQVIECLLLSRENQRLERKVHAEEAPTLPAYADRRLGRAAAGLDEDALRREETIGVVANGRYQKDLAKHRGQPTKDGTTARQFAPVVIPDLGTVGSIARRHRADWFNGPPESGAAERLRLLPGSRRLQ